MDFVELRSRVLGAAPGLKKILAAKGALTLFEYQLESLGTVPAISVVRQEELLDVISNKVRQIDPGVVPDVLHELRTHYTVSTGDHHGPLTHPFSLSGQWSRLAVLEATRTPVAITLSCGSVSLNNSSFPRGHFFHTRSGKERRLSFFTLHNRHHPVYGLPGYRQKELDAFRSEMILTPEMSSQDIGILTEIINTLFAPPQALSFASFAEQISYTNYWLWKKIAGQEKTACLFLDQESIVNELLVRYHLGQSTPLDQLLTDTAWHDSFEQFFDGCVGAFSSSDKKGTFLFWALQDGERKSLERKSGALVSRDGRYMVELTSKALVQALIRHELIPSMALCFIVVSFYYGLRCGGGFLQVSYLADMKKRYKQLLETMQAPESESTITQNVQTDYLAVDFACLNIQTANGMVGATSFDFLLYQDAATAKRLKALLHSCTLGEAIDQLMPEFYKIFFHATPQVTVPAKFSPVLYAK